MKTVAAAIEFGTSKIITGTLKGAAREGKEA